ncbi:glutathione S-transferase family protein [Microbaculum marinum]|uniref:Glutathione S-transferase family protein n=1 Tax=Microbaculum marinum TaxID=1764581 RepID=A0AAW9RGM9_9HYPH
MKPELYAHPFSSYCQKVLTALYENATPFDFRLIQFQDRADEEALEAAWPMKRFPVLLDDGRTIVESTVIIEYLQHYHPGAVRLIPDDFDAALEVRMLDRVFDNYVMTPLQKIVFDRMQPDPDRDAAGVASARRILDMAYRWLDGKLAGRAWAAGEDFSMADCAAAPSLFYADWVHEIGTGLTHLRRYRDALLSRPSFACAVEEARPYRELFPGGAPDRD